MNDKILSALNELMSTILEDANFKGDYASTECKGWSMLFDAVQTVQKEIK